VDIARQEFRLIQLEGDWYWHLDIRNDERLIGPFSCREEAEKDAGETLGLSEDGAALKCFARPAIPHFSVIQRESGWFWCSDPAWDMRGAEALIGPFESRGEAVRDAWEALGIKDGEG
jgi:hypothetical protein